MKLYTTTANGYTTIVSSAAGEIYNGIWSQTRTLFKNGNSFVDLYAVDSNKKYLAVQFDVAGNYCKFCNTAFIKSPTLNAANFSPYYLGDGGFILQNGVLALTSDVPGQHLVIKEYDSFPACSCVPTANYKNTFLDNKAGILARTFQVPGVTTYTEYVDFYGITKEGFSRSGGGLVGTFDNSVLDGFTQFASPSCQGTNYSATTGVQPPYTFNGQFGGQFVTYCGWSTCTDVRFLSTGINEGSFVDCLTPLNAFAFSREATCVDASSLATLIGNTALWANCNLDNTVGIAGPANNYFMAISANDCALFINFSGFSSHLASAVYFLDDDGYLYAAGSVFNGINYTYQVQRTSIAGDVFDQFKKQALSGSGPSSIGKASCVNFARPVSVLGSYKA